MNWSNNPLFNPITLFGLLVIAYACVFAALYTGFRCEFHVIWGFPFAVGAAYLTWRKVVE